MAEFNQVLTTHEEKLSYVTEYLISDNKYPLVIVGNGGEGKTKIIQLAIKNCKKNVAVIDNGSLPRFYKGEENNFDFKLIIINTASNEKEMMEQLKETINPTFIQFKPDPAFNKTE